jgi:NitT/TauT family transport system substrate-binding protein
LRRVATLRSGLALLVLGLTVAWTPLAAAEQKIGIGTFRALFHVPLWVAVDGGFLEREGVRSELLFFASGNEMTTAMLGRSIGIAGTMSDRPAVLLDRGQQTRHLIALSTRSAFSIIVRRDFAGPVGAMTTLRGRKLGITQRGSSTDVALRILLREAALDPDRDVILTPTGNQNAGIAALAASQVDALILTEPGTSIAISQGVAKMFLDLRPLEAYGAKLGFGTLQATEQFIREHPDTVKRTIVAVCKATKALRADPELAFKSAVRQFPKVEPDVLRMALAGELPTLGSVITEEMIGAVSRANVEAKVIKRAYTYSDVVVDGEFTSLWRC